MATNTELTSLYGELRAILLARHFAVGRYFRANYLSLFNKLGVLRCPGSQTPGDGDDAEVGCNSERIRPSTYSSAADLLSLGATKQQVERWRIGNRVRENPLYFSCQALICLAVEHHLGRTNVEPIIRQALRSIGSMYKFDGAFAGYPVRWDAVTSDRWVTRAEAGQPKPRYCCDFLLSEDRTSYLYCTPFQDPRYTPYVRNEDFMRMTYEQKRAYMQARHHSLEFHRTWEPSMDELIGLVCGYDIVFRLVDDEGIREMVRRQVNSLGEYLAEHSYLLVRPGGGFAARGASDVLPVFEFPWQRVFERITGNRYEPRVGFEGALAKAGVWASIEGAMRTATITAVVATVALTAILVFLAGGVLGLLIAVLGPALGLTLGIVAARALVIFVHRGFDVYGWPGDGSEEFKEERKYQEAFATAYLVKKLPQALRFRLWFGAVGDRGEGPATQFPPYVGLTGLDDAEGTVRRMYLTFLPERRRHPEIDKDFPPLGPYGFYATNVFASAVAVVLGAGEEEERNLVRLLDQLHDDLDNNMKRDFALKDEMDTVIEPFVPALAYMASLALAWLHAKRRTESGSPIPADIDFPIPPVITDSFPIPSIPLEVLDAVRDGFLFLPADTWGQNQEVPPADGALLDGFRPPGKQDDAPPPELKPSAAKQLVIDVTVTVTEADSDVDTGVDIETEDEYVIDASGQIWAGVLATPPNGPNGWTNIDYDLKFPLHGGPDGHPFALIGKLGAGGGYFFVGERYPRLAPNQMLSLDPETRRLMLRTNDDKPGNGSKREPGKAFSCRIRVWR